MKKTNILTSILNIIVQISYLIWVFVYYDTYIYNKIMSILSISFFSMYLFMGQTIVMAIINLVVGIKNRKKSITNLVIYIVIAVLFIIQLIFFYLAEKRYEHWCDIVLIASYFLIYALDIFTVILTLRKVPKSEKKTKYDTIIFIIVIVTVILCLIIPQIVFLSITKKFEEAATTDELNKTKYVLLKKGNTYSFVNENEEIEFSINASDCAKEETVYGFENGKKLKFINIMDNGVLKAIDINNPKNLKEIYSCKSMNGYVSQEVFDTFVKADKLRNDYSIEDEEITRNNLYKNEEVSKYKNYEESSDYIYTYYSNSDITVQVAELKENARLVSDNGEINENKELQREIYLINNYGKDKIKLNCEDLMYRIDKETNEKYIYLHDDKYIAFINKNKNTNGYFNLQGEQVAEIVNNYVFLDINEKCSLVAKITDRNKAIVKDDNSVYLNVQCMLINNDLKIISDEYNNVDIYGNFYILGNTLLNKNGEILNKDISGIEGTFYNGKMIAIKDNETKEYQLWDKNHQITSFDYIDVKEYYDIPYFYDPYGIQIDEIYVQALKQM